VRHVVGRGHEACPAAGQPPLVIFDLDGVIYRGDTVLPYAADAVATLRRRGATVFYLTNNSTRTRESYSRKLTEMGIPTHPNEIMTSAYATALYFLENHLDGTTAYVIGEEGLVDELTRAGVRVLRGDENGPVESVVVGLDREFTYRKLLRAQQAILAGARFIATNGDLTFPVEEGKVIPGGGSLIAAVQAATSKAPLMIGKPESYAVERILQITGASPERTFMVGDRMDTDILAGRRMGLHTVLVLTGVTRAEDVESAPEEMRPEIVLPDLARLPEVVCTAP
jgi:4-nitrophenyl phosphatase